MKHLPHRPFVSVVTPVFNRPQGIIEASQSLINQTYENWEHIIVDDCSTDDTPMVLSSVVDKRIRVFKTQKNSGPQFAYKKGFDEAKGKYIFMLDSDDILLPDCIEKCVDFLKKNKVDVLHTGIYRVTRHQTLPIAVWIYTPVPKQDKKRLFKEQYLSGSCILTKEIAKKFTPDIRAKGSWDWYFLLQLQFAGARFGSLNEGLYVYFRNDTGLANTHEQTGNRKKSFSFIRKYVRENI